LSTPLGVELRIIPHGIPEFYIVASVGANYFNYSSRFGTNYYSSTITVDNLKERNGLFVLPYLIILPLEKWRDFLSGLSNLGNHEIFDNSEISYISFISCKN